MTAIPTAITEMIRAIQDRISGHRLCRRCASHKQSQCAGVPSLQPPVASASCSQVLDLNSLGYPLSIDGVGEDMLEAYVREAKAYRTLMDHNGLLPEALLRRDLTVAAYLAIFAVPELVAELKATRALLAIRSNASRKKHK